MKTPKKMFALIALGLGLLAPATVSADQDQLLVQSGEKIAFMGDSITAGGVRKGGYVTLAMEALNHEGLGLKMIPAGVSGNRSKDMLARLDKSVLSKKPDWMVLSCGVNDVWHFTLKLGKRTFVGVPLEDYKKNIREMIGKALAADIKVLILTSTMIGEDPKKETNLKLAPYNEFLHEIAKEKDLPIADLNQQMQEALEKIPDEEGRAKMFGEPKYDRKIKNKLTTDGCHMNKAGNMMMAKGVLKAFGLSDQKIAAAEERWTGR